MNKESGSSWKLGMFVIMGLVAFTTTIYFVGKQKNLFGSTFRLNSHFANVSGLEVGNNVLFSGINVGTVSEIQLITDTSVVVRLLIKEDVQQFIKSDAMASIGSDGLMGDKVLSISAGTSSKKMVKDNDNIASIKAIEMDEIMRSVKVSMDNASIITAELAQFTYNMNHGNGALSKLITDEKFANSMTKTLTNLQTGSKGLSENMEAAKHNILLKGYFNKKKKAEAKKIEEMQKIKEEKADSEIKK
ncbi:MlaD family protein [Flavobacterium degerlachei]|jgi:phospholipid/cholesterol/gamma-HCH transport system substrate-binding protein|uniref:Phospholipid/cholesterol/gamma-HCH transport system substrate-binding protein n=1 Tax=Flavobacterium degerlachei TaxID=229203 RepID=A0A1H3BPB9_9FLAO|nr:MlaD family protein [Flavobacterium degerlachei]SDX43561.1 phospholipid/cholesterol/gamma-HCH transport system substrate-binding protein [Flavobacterium degerlachei]